MAPVMTFYKGCTNGSTWQVNMQSFSAADSAYSRTGSFFLYDCSIAQHWLYSVDTWKSYWIFLWGCRADRHYCVLGNSLYAGYFDS